MMNWMRNGPAPSALLAFGGLTLLSLSAPTHAALRVCADPGNMPISNDKGEGFENKLAEVLAKAMGTAVTYYYRPGVERGLTRTTLDADQCDVMLDMPPDSDDVLTTGPLYRTTYVFAYRSDRGYDFKTFDDPRLKKLKVGVYETSAVREALDDHGVRNLQIHYLSHNADLVAQNQPSYQVQQVIDGTLDVAAVWGPLAGYFKSVQHAPITLQPVNLMDDQVPMQYEMALAVRRGNRDLQQQLGKAMATQKDALRAVLVQFGVPLVQCEECVISGELAAHGPYRPVSAPQQQVQASTVSLAQVDEWLAHGSNPVTELLNAVTANDNRRVLYLIEKKHVSATDLDPQGESALNKAVTMASPQMVELLVAHGADVNERDADGWTPILTAAYLDRAEDVKILAAHGADPNVRSRQELTPLGVAAQYDKSNSAVALLEAGADPAKAVGEGGYTPLMLATGNNSTSLVQALLKKGVDVNARNSGGVTALMIAAAKGHPDMVQLLLQAGADTQVQSERGDTALSIAKIRGDEKVLKLLGESPGHPGA